MSIATKIGRDSNVQTAISESTTMMQRVTGLLVLLATLLMPCMGLADELGDIQTRKTVRIGVAEFTPWTFKNLLGKLEGFEIDVGGRIALDIGVTPEFKVYAWDAIIAALERGEIDFIAAGLAITPGRALRVEYSSPYASSGITLVSNMAQSTQGGGIDELNKKGVVIAAVGETLGAEIAPLLFDVAKVRSFASAHAAETELLQGPSTPI